MIRHGVKLAESSTSEKDFGNFQLIKIMTLFYTKYKYFDTIRQ